MKAKSSTLVSVIPQAEKTGRCEILPNSYVRKIEVDRRGRATGAVYFDANRRERRQRAKAVILAANGVESAKLLLISGIANSSGLVGKHLMWDNGAFASGLFEHPLNEYKSIQVTRLIHDYYRHDPKRGFYGGGGIDARFDFYPAGFALYGMPQDAPRWGAEYKRLVGHYFNRTCSLLSHSTSLPQLKNSVSLDPDVKDEWGLPAVRITFDHHADDIANMRWLQKRQFEILNEMGARKTWGPPPEDFVASRHLIGTCRMGRDPKKSVVDPFGRSHDIPNLFIVDGSNFVTSARQQPTATIQALAYRSADRAIALAKQGTI